MKRHERLEQDVKVALSNIISYEVKSASVADSILSVTDVSITPDQKYAKVFISAFGKSNKSKIIESLNKVSGYIRGSLGSKVKMRNVPALTFVLDDSVEYGAHMDKVINEVIKKDTKGKNDKEN